MNLPDIVRAGARPRRIRNGLGPSAKRGDQVEPLQHGLGGRYEDPSPRDDLEPRFYPRVSAQLH